MLILFLIVFIDLVGFGLIIPLLPFYAEFFNATPLVVGLVMATYSFTQFLAAPMWGRLSDRLGRRPILLTSLAGISISYVWLGFADSLWVLFAARALGGFMAGNLSAAFAYVADVTTKENRAKGMGLIGAAFGLGFIAGPAIGGFLAGPDPLNADYQTPAFAAAGMSFIALSLALVKLKESLAPEIRARLAARPPHKRWAQFREALQKPYVGLLIGLTFLATFVIGGMEATFAMWSWRQMGWGPEQNGYLFATVGIVSALVQGGMIGRLVRRFGEKRLVIQGAVLLALGIFLIPFSTNLPVLMTAMLTLTFGYSILTPTLNSLITLQVGEEEQGGVMGIARSAATLARVLGPAWAGLLFHFLGKDWPYLMGGAVMAGVVFLAARGLKSVVVAEEK